MAVREGRWDCTQCGTKNIKGREMSCPGCGVTRANDTQFYLADGEPIISDPEQIKRAMKGADWYCGYCQRGNQNDSAKCSKCGADRNTSPAIQREKYAPALTSRPVSGSTQVNTFSDVSSSEDDPPTFTPGSVSGLTKLGITAGILFLIFIVGYLVWPRKIDVEVTGFSWERSIEISAYQTVTEEDWDIPTGGRELSHRREIRSYNHVLDHYESRTRRVQTGTEEYTCGSRNLGNGYFEDVKCSRAVYGSESYQEPVYRDDPVYDTKYKYKINKWIHARTATAGIYESPVKDPQWPQLNLIGNGTDTLGNEREGNRSEKYTVHFVSKEKKPRKFSEVYEQKRWEEFEYGAVYEAKLSFGSLSNFKMK